MKGLLRLHVTCFFHRLADDNYSSANFAKPSVFVDPRRAMVGIRWTF